MAEKSDEISKWYQILCKSYEEYRNQLSERQQKVYKLYLIDSYDIWPDNTTLEDELTRVKFVFQQMASDNPNDEQNVFIYSMFIFILEDWYRLTPFGAKYYEAKHREWMKKRLGNPDEDSFRKYISILEQDMVDLNLIGKDNIKQICGNQDGITILSHSYMLGRHFIWNTEHFDTNSVARIFGFFDLSRRALDAYAVTFNYPIYISQLDASMQSFVADRDKFTRWAHAVNGPIRKQVGDKYELWDNVCFYARVDGFMQPKLSRQNAANLLYAMCPKIGTESAQALYTAMSRGGKSRKVEEYDALNENNEVKVFCKTLQNFI